ncbi:MAG TPA: UDP-N-acetylglucosamine 1-carboxyvinyltransferase [Bdellovibrionota bacterium]|nr:UDP-N-acetylglucosamine 1-carboxyvinyltransferase [Bdellovibrionota bacterium]
MDKIIIEGGKPLFGEVFISGAKNSVLPLLFASLLTDEECVFENVPQLKDVTTALTLLKEFGVDAEHHGETIRVRAKSIEKPFAPYELVKTMRASVLALGPLLARVGRVHVALPGGCAIGSRPINLHLQALSKLGADMTLHEGYVLAQAKKLVGTNLYFETSTVTGTENILMAACLAEGTTIIENAAREPEIIDLANCLNSMGADIEGAGASKIIVRGKRGLKGCHYTIMPDRIEAGTYAVAAVATQGDVIIRNCDPEHMQALLTKLSDSGALIENVDTTSIRVRGIEQARAFNLQTEPYPGFATDMQAQMMALACVAQGTSALVENIFENRFMHVCELQRMGAHIEVKGSMALVQGRENLIAAPVMATDLRASVCLVIAGLIAQGKTEIHRIYHLDRGYEKLEEKFLKLGANITRVPEHATSIPVESTPWQQGIVH